MVYYTIYALVRIYMRIHESHHQLPGFAILKRKKKKKITHGALRGILPSSCIMGAAILAVISRRMECFPMLILGQISSDLQMVDGGASDSEGSDISDIDEYISDQFDGETDGFRH